MTKMKWIKSAFLTACVFVFSMSYGLAQCAMCRATVENNVSNGDTTVGAGLNMGIIYLFSAPYVLLAAIGFFWYRHAKKNKKLRHSSSRY